VGNWSSNGFIVSTLASSVKLAVGGGVLFAIRGY